MTMMMMMMMIVIESLIDSWMHEFAMPSTFLNFNQSSDMNSSQEFLLFLKQS